MERKKDGMTEGVLNAYGEREVKLIAGRNNGTGKGREE